MAVTNSALYKNLDKLREDLSTKATKEALGMKTDYGSEALLNDLYGEITTEQDYDVTTDPAYAGMKKAAYREADRTMRDTLAQGNAKSNGFTNSAAITAASQARDYSMSQFDDKVAALEDRALSKKNAKINTKMQLLSALEGMETQKRQTYLEDLQLIESAANEQKSAAETEAKNIISMGGIPSDELMAKAGWSQEYIKNVKQSTVDNMDDLTLQRYMFNLGADLDTNAFGIWGPKSEAAYQKLFGKASGRLNASSGGGGGSGYTSKKSGTSQQYTSQPVDNSTVKKNSSGKYSVGGAQFEDEARAQLYKMYKDGDINYQQYSANLKAYAKH